MPALIQRNTRVGSAQDPRWCVVRKLGEGQFAEVYEVKDSHSKDRDIKYAMKVEKRRESKTVKAEHKVLKRLLQSSQQVCKMYDAGLYDERFFIVMELLGENLAEARRNMPTGRFDLADVQCIGMSTLNAIECMHKAGFIHRDVKPANFAVFPTASTSASGTWAIIDFGLARRYVSDSGELLAARKDASFRGSTTYASVHAHQEYDQGRRDDLWSWLYIMVELMEGTLPWRLDKEGEISREQVLKRKQRCMRCPQELSPTNSLPAPLQHISNHLLTLNFEDSPNYDHIRRHLHCLTSNQPYPSPATTTTTTAAPAAPAAVMNWSTGGGADLYPVDACEHEQPPSPFWNMEQQTSSQPINASSHEQPHAHAAAPHTTEAAEADHQYQPSFRGASTSHPHKPPPTNPRAGSLPPDLHTEQPQSKRPRLDAGRMADGRWANGTATAGVAGTTTEVDMQYREGGMAGHDLQAVGVEAGGLGSGWDGRQPQAQPQTQTQAQPQTQPQAQAGVIEPSIAPWELSAPAECTEAAAPSVEAASEDEERVSDVTGFVNLFKQGQVSVEAQEAVRCLCRLDPAEGLAAMAVMMDVLVNRTQHSGLPFVASFLASMAAFTKDASKRALLRHCAP